MQNAFHVSRSCAKSAVHDRKFHSQKYRISDKFIELNCQFNFRISMGVDRKVPLIGQILKNCAGNIDLGYDLIKYRRALFYLQIKRVQFGGQLSSIRPLMNIGK